MKSTEISEMQENVTAKKNIVIAGGGPAGLTLAYELARWSEDIHPIVFEASATFGGISRTVRYHDNYIDIGGHRFFSKLDRINRLWQELMSVQTYPSKDELLISPCLQQNKDAAEEGNPELRDEVFLRRRRVSRIYFNGRFFDYPVSLSAATLRAMGLAKTAEIVSGFLKATLHKMPETSLESFYINRFGRPLYSMFFEHYTEKVWGIHPSQLSADWGAQRVKGLSLKKIVSEMARKRLHLGGERARKVETSLIEEFYYPKYGPGQMWTLMAEKSQERGADIRVNSRVSKVHVGADRRVKGVTVTDADGKDAMVECDFFASSLPLCELINSLEGIEVPEDVERIANGLVYRDFITVGLLLPKLKIENSTKIKTYDKRIPDTWIYIQDPGVKLGRIQIFNNWSPYTVKDYENCMWIGLEYFCNEGDELWEMPREAFIEMAKKELERLGIASDADVKDAVEIKARKAYPSYSGTYPEIGRLREFLDTIPNLFCIGRNGQHRYNNMDHSMMTALLTADLLRGREIERKYIWEVNTESDYHEEE